MISASNRTFLTFLLAVTLMVGCSRQGGPGESHAGESASAHPAGEAPDAHTGEPAVSHAGEAPGAHAEEAAGAHAGEAPGAHAAAGEIELRPEAIAMAGITLTPAATGRISGAVDLSGEVGFNEDRLVHITPRFAGIAREARLRLGDYVNAGEVVATIESNESMTQYSLKAPIAGHIVQKHIVPGEHVSETESIYILADLSTVWVHLAVYPKDASAVRRGQKVRITAVGADHSADAVIEYVTPVMDPQTRSMTARVVLANGSGEWRPGTFVNAHVQTGEGDEGLVVAKDAVQIVGEKTVVFVSDEPNRFAPVEVVVGASDDTHTRILSGLEPGTPYVSKGAFELKAKIVTSSLGGHAGHGH